MAVLLDTSVLGRLANAADPNHGVARRAVAELRRQGELLVITAQNLIEFRNFATRPRAANGLGMSPTDAALEAAQFEVAFPMLDETPAIYPAWRAVAVTVGVVGKQVHDARLVAVCHAHAVSHLLKFNVAHFARLGAAPPGVTILDPASV